MQFRTVIFCDAKPGTEAYKELLEIIYNLKLDIGLVSVEPADSLIEYPPWYKIIALGSKASKALTSRGIPHSVLPQK